MLHELQNFYLEQDEPKKSCFIALQGIILEMGEDITEHWKYKLPFFYYMDKPFCYLWYDKKNNEPYIGVVKADRFDHPMLEKGNRKRMKIFRIDPCADIPIDSIKEVLSEAMKYY